MVNRIFLTACWAVTNRWKNIDHVAYSCYSFTLAQITANSKSLVKIYDDFLSAFFYLSFQITMHIITTALFMCYTLRLHK